MSVTTLPPPAGRRRRRIAALGRCRSGLALTEFAFGFPIVMALGLYGLETANLALAHLRVSNISMLSADNIARVRDSIDESNIIEVLEGAKGTGSGIRFADNARIIVTSFEPNSDNTRQWIRWQRCTGALNVSSNYGQPRNQSNQVIADGSEYLRRNDKTVQPASQQSSPNHATLTAIGPAGNQITAQPGNAVIVAEVSYDYQPLVSNSLFGPIRIRYENAFTVRQRTDQRPMNANRVDPRSCDTFSA